MEALVDEVTPSKAAGQLHSHIGWTLLLFTRGWELTSSLTLSGGQQCPGPRALPSQLLGHVQCLLQPGKLRCLHKDHSVQRSNYISKERQTESHHHNEQPLPAALSHFSLPLAITSKPSKPHKCASSPYREGPSLQFVPGAPQFSKQGLLSQIASSRPRPLRLYLQSQLCNEDMGHGKNMSSPLENLKCLWAWLFVVGQIRFFQSWPRIFNAFLFKRL